MKINKNTGAPLSSGVAGWGDAAVLVPYEMYRLTGNRPVLEKHYGTMRRWADYVITTAARQRGDNDLPVETDQYLWNTGFQFGEWLIPSQPEAGADFAACKVSSVYTTPIFGWLSVNTMAKVAGILDRAEKTYYAEMADKMKAAIHRGLMADGNMPAELMGAYVLAAALDLTPPEHAQAFAGKLVQMLTQNGGCLDTGFLATPYLLDAFVKIGRRDLALGLLWQGKQPSWLFEVDNGATTIWESWFSKHADGAPQITSFNHYAFGCVDDWIFRHIAGIECTEPGFGHFSVRPLPDTPLAWCKRSFMSSCGEIAVHWTKDTLEVTVPCNAAATVHWKGKTLEAGSGKHIF